MITIRRESALSLVHEGPLRIRLVPLLALSAVLAAVAFRVQLVLRADFPLVDGGLFYAMARDIEAAGFSLPLYTSYNGGTIPFAYPPLQLYVAALLDASKVLDLLDILRLSPLVANVLTIGAFYFLAREFLTSRNERVLATAAFTLSPGSFYWTLMGGGLTRSWGFLFAILTIAMASRMYSDGGKVRTALTSLLAALTILSHPTMATFAAVACMLVFLAKGRSKAGVLRSLAVAAGAVALSAPWWLAILLRFGPLPLTEAIVEGDLSYGGLTPLLLLLVYQGIQFSPVVVFLGVLGVLSSVKERRYLLTGWLAVMVVFEPRAFDWTSTVAWSLLVGIGAAYIIRAASVYATSEARSRLLALTVGLLIIVHVVLSARLANTLLVVLPVGERTAMAWIKTNTASSSCFLVLGSTDPATFTSEWFPALSERTSETTPQGYEWRGEFIQRAALYWSSMSCVEKDSSCLAQWSSEHKISFDYVYLSEAWRRSPLAASLRADLEYAMIYDGPGATVFRHLPPQVK